MYYLVPVVAVDSLKVAAVALVVLQIYRAYLFAEELL
tara:strand:+ start:46 stop:156 length:111 start_codon:yes stop_codon:yes gene_type:complete